MVNKLDLRLVNRERLALCTFNPQSRNNERIFFLKNLYLFVFPRCLITGTNYLIPQVVIWELQENGALFECSEVRASHKCVAAHSCVAVTPYGTCTFPQCTQRANLYSGIIVRALNDEISFPVPFLCFIILFNSSSFVSCFIYFVFCFLCLLSPFVLVFLYSAPFFTVTAYLPAAVILQRGMTCRLLWCPEVERMDKMVDPSEVLRHRVPG